MEPASERVLGAVLELAPDLGLPADRPVVLREGSSLLVHLRPAPVVARAALKTAAVRAGPDWYARELAVAAHLVEAGAPVVPPAADVAPGPHVRDGTPITFWRYAEPSGDPVDPEAAGRGLRICHEALADFAGPLPRLALLHEAEAVAERLGDPALHRVARAARAEVEALDLPVQAVHGDGDLNNVIQTRDGPLWNDWEDTMLAPVAWDLACLAHDRSPLAPAAQRAYGPAPPDLAAFVAARTAQVDVWTALFARLGS